MILVACGGEEKATELILRERATAAGPRTIEGFQTVTRLEGGDIDEEWEHTVVRPKTGREVARLRVPFGSYRLHVRAVDPLATDLLMFECDRRIEIADDTGTRSVVTALRERDCAIDTDP